MRARFLLLAFVLSPGGIGGCDDPGPAPEGGGSILELRPEAGAGLSLDSLQWAPADAVREITGALPGRRLLQVLPAGAGKSLRLRGAGACPLELTLPASGSARLVPVLLRGRHGAGGDRRFLSPGPGQVVVLSEACPEAGGTGAPLQWKQVSGKPAPHTVSENGHRLELQMPPWPRPSGPISGVLPRSPAQLPTLGFLGIGKEEGKASAQRLLLDSLPRATGFPALAVGQRVVVGPSPLELVRAPTGGQGALVPADPTRGTPTTFQPGVAGRWILEDPAGQQIMLSARRHDHTRLDCARSGCHPKETAAYAASPMATVGRRGWEGELGPDFDPACALACHGTSEPGLPDGGAHHVARELDFALPSRGAPGTWDALPRDLRRVAGIGCTPCHGPGSLPEHRSSWVILRAEVCATCHDAPPRYPLVQAWRRGAKARADADPTTRSPGCARCHTTGGFLEAIGHLSRPVVPEGEPQPGPAGITCAACHAPHREDAGASGLRQPRPPTHLGRGEGAPGIPERVRVCLACHSSPPEEGPPRSSVGELVYGTPETFEIENPHAGVDCGTCHDPHELSVKTGSCVECHAEGRPPDPTPGLRAEAARLLGQRLPGQRRHLPWRFATDPARARAYRQAALVAADRAAGVHGAPRARALLEAARKVLDPDP